MGRIGKMLSVKEKITEEMDVDQEIVVSVIVLTYNHDRFIARALDSILAQETPFEYEILVGDDCSNDGTHKILEQYALEHPDKLRLFFNAENMGTTWNSYNLMTKAKGRYLAACEGDDFWTDTKKLALQVDFLEHHSEYIGCAHKVRLVDENEIPLRCQYLDWISPKEHYTIKDFKGIVLPGHSSTLVRRNIFLNDDHDYSIMWRANKWIGDRTSNLLYVSQGDFYKMNRVMSCYRQSTNGKKQSITSRIYGKNLTVQPDYEYTCELERYACEVLHVDAGFEHHKAELLISTLRRWRLHNDEIHKNAGIIFEDLKRNSRWPLLLIEAMEKKMKSAFIRTCSRVLPYTKEP